MVDDVCLTSLFTTLQWLLVASLASCWFSCFRLHRQPWLRDPASASPSLAETFWCGFTLVLSGLAHLGALVFLLRCGKDLVRVVLLTVPFIASAILGLVLYVEGILASGRGNGQMLQTLTWLCEHLGLFNDVASGLAATVLLVSLWHSEPQRWEDHALALASIASAGSTSYVLYRALPVMLTLPESASLSTVDSFFRERTRHSATLQSQSSSAASTSSPEELHCPVGRNCSVALLASSVVVLLGWAIQAAVRLPSLHDPGREILLRSGTSLLYCRPSPSSVSCDWDLSRGAPPQASLLITTANVNVSVGLQSGNCCNSSFCDSANGPLRCDFEGPGNGFVFERTSGLYQLGTDDGWCYVAADQSIRCDGERSSPSSAFILEPDTSKMCSSKPFQCLDLCCIQLHLALALPPLVLLCALVARPDPVEATLEFQLPAPLRMRPPPEPEQTSDATFSTGSNSAGLGSMRSARRAEQDQVLNLTRLDFCAGCWRRRNPLTGSVSRSGLCCFEHVATDVCWNRFQAKLRVIYVPLLKAVVLLFGAALAAGAVPLLALWLPFQRVRSRRHSFDIKEFLLMYQNNVLEAFHDNEPLLAAMLRFARALAATGLLAWAAVPTSMGFFRDWLQKELPADLIGLSWLSICPSFQIPQFAACSYAGLGDKLLSIDAASLAITALLFYSSCITRRYVPFSWYADVHFIVYREPLQKKGAIVVSRSTALPASSRQKERIDLCNSIVGLFCLVPKVLAVVMTLLLFLVPDNFAPLGEPLSQVVPSISARRWQRLAVAGTALLLDPAGLFGSLGQIAWFLVLLPTLFVCIGLELLLALGFVARCGIGGDHQLPCWWTVALLRPLFLVRDQCFR